MGTNYYLDTDICKHCGRSGERLHIGKSSAGWVFALHVYPDKGIHDLIDWMPYFKKDGNRITNEYGDVISPHNMLSTIMARYHLGTIPELVKPSYDPSTCEHGPMGLIRSKVSARYSHVVKQGEGTWDCHIGDFS